jgi:hypothetical protein
MCFSKPTYVGTLLGIQFHDSKIIDSNTILARKLLNPENIVCEIPSDILSNHPFLPAKDQMLPLQDGLAMRIVFVLNLRDRFRDHKEH